MKTTSYNPSKIEVALADALSEMGEEISAKMSDLTIQEIDIKTKEDNPSLVLRLTDEDNDPHEVVIKIIQRPDNF